MIKSMFSGFFARSSMVLALISGLLWCVFMYALYRRAVDDKAEQTERLALMQTRTLYAQIVDARTWNSAHGGVYVPESELGVPNPHIPEEHRAITTTDGRRLVLMNPAYMSRQISEFGASKGAHFRITSHSPLRTENMSDSWETTALDDCVDGKGEIFKLVEADGGQYYRYMAPLRTDSACLACHTGNHEGDVRGGISVKLDARPFLQEAERHEASMGMAFALMGLTGFVGIGGLTLTVNRKRFMAEESNRIKSKFLANMSHDMRTPLGGILGMSELIAGAESRVERERLSRNLQAAGNALLDMLSDLTDHALFDAGRLNLACHEFNTRDLFESCLDLVRPACRMKNLALALAVDSDVPRHLVGDSFRLRQAVSNLLGNAVKFTEFGAIDVVVSAQNIALGKIKLCCEVRDTGPGIAEGEEKKIFERFEQGRAALEHKIHGTGLGLSIAREIALMMNGSLVVRGNAGGGAIFSLGVELKLGDGKNTEPGPLGHGGEERLTSALPLAPALAPAPLPPPDEAGCGLQVLVAEDNAVNAHFLSEVLKRAGHTAIMAGNGSETLRLLARHQPDALLLDLRMPDPDGFAIAEMIRSAQTSAPADLPVFILSASLSAEDGARLDSLGVSGRALKPISGRALLELLSGVVARQEANAGEPPVQDRVAALAAMDGHEDLLGRLEGIFKADLPEQLAALEKAVQQKDLRELMRLAHSLKNSARMLYFIHLGQAGADLEESSRQGQVEPHLIGRVFDEAERVMKL